MQPGPERRLVTILAADVVGYSAMMERDEAGTLEQLKRSRDLIRTEIARRQGRVFGTAGDSLVAEFGSVVNAVESAVHIQRGLAERNASLPENRRMRFRIGVNLGDVMVDDDDLFGDGVNIAARLQGLAEPGGVLISGPVFDQVRNKLSLGFDFLGPQPVKNISDPVSVWRVVLDGATPAPPSPDRQRAAAAAPPEESPRARLIRSAAFAALLIVLLFAINLFANRGDRLWAQWPTLGILLLLGIRAIRLIGR